MADGAGRPWGRESIWNLIATLFRSRAALLALPTPLRRNAAASLSVEEMTSLPLAQASSTQIFGRDRPFDPAVPPRLTRRSHSSLSFQVPSSKDRWIPNNRSWSL